MLITKSPNATFTPAHVLLKNAPSTVEVDRGPQVGGDGVSLSSEHKPGFGNRAMRGLAATGVVAASSATGPWPLSPAASLAW
jgi:hypothetical protein